MIFDKADQIHDVFHQYYTFDKKLMIHLANGPRDTSVFQILDKWGRSPENAGRQRAGNVIEKEKTSPISLPGPAQLPARFSIIPPDWEPGTDYRHTSKLKKRIVVGVCLSQEIMAFCLVSSWVAVPDVTV